MKVLVVSDGTPDSESALAYGLAKARETSGQLIALHVHQHYFPRDDAGRSSSHQALQDSRRRYESIRTWIHNHGCGVSANADFSIIDDYSDILRYASDAEIDLIVSPPAFVEMFDKARCLVDIVSAEDEQMVNS